MSRLWAIVLPVVKLIVNVSYLSDHLLLVKLLQLRAGSRAIPPVLTCLGVRPRGPSLRCPFRLSSTDVKYRVERHLCASRRNRCPVAGASRSAASSWACSFRFCYRNSVGARSGSKAQRRFSSHTFVVDREGRAILSTRLRHLADSICHMHRCSQLHKILRIHTQNTRNVSSFRG